MVHKIQHNKSCMYQETYKMEEQTICSFLLFLYINKSFWFAAPFFATYTYTCSKVTLTFALKVTDTKNRTKTRG